MELLRPPHPTKAANKTFNRIRDEVKSALSGYKADPETIKVVTDFYEKYIDARYRNVELQQSWDIIGAMQAIKTAYPDSVEMFSMLHFILREQVDFAIRYPYYYLDVHPPSEENMFSLEESVCSRDMYVRNIYRATQDDNLAKFMILGTSNNLGMNCDDRAKTKVYRNVINYEINITDAIILDLANFSSPDITHVIFRFGSTCDPDVSITQQENNYYNLNITKVMNVIEYKKLRKYMRGTKFSNWAEKIDYLNFRIASWVYDDIIVHLLKKLHNKSNKYNIVIHLPHIQINSLANLFARMETTTCNMRITLDFPPTNIQYPDEMYKPLVSMSDIQSIFAAYFEKSHEVYRANVPKSDMYPVLPNDADGSLQIRFTEQSNPLYFKIRECFEYGNQIIDNNKVIYSEHYLENAANSYIKKFNDVKPVAEKPKLTMLLAAMGTGKSTYIRENRKGKIYLEMDDIFYSLEEGDKKFMNADNKYVKKVTSYVNNMLQHYPNILSKVIARTICSNTNNMRTRPYKTPALIICDKIINKCAELKYDVLLSDTGYRTTKTPILDMCGNLNTHDNLRAIKYIDEISAKFDCEIVILYVDFISQYNQQLFRFLTESRMASYYSVKKRTYMIFTGLQTKWKNVECYLLDNFNFVPIIKNSKLIFKNFDKYKKIDSNFVKFVQQF